MNWSSILQRNLDPGGLICREGLDSIFGENRVTIKSDMLKMVLEKIKTITDRL